VTASHVQASAKTTVNATTEVDSESEAEKKHKHKKGSRVKNGKMVDGGHTRCAKEGENCACEGMVTYVVDDNKMHDVRPEDNLGKPQMRQKVDGAIACNNDAFGADPAPGKAKHCVCSNPPYEQRFGIGKYTAREGEELDCVGTVIYGHSKDGW